MVRSISFVSPFLRAVPITACEVLTSTVKLSLVPELPPCGLLHPSGASTTAGRAAVNRFFIRRSPGGMGAERAWGDGRPAGSHRVDVHTSNGCAVRANP